MPIKNIKWICVLLMAWLAAGCVRKTENEETQEWKIALKADKNPESMLQVKQALEIALRQIAGKNVEIIVPTSAAVILEGLGNGTLDAGYISAMEYLQSRRHRAAKGLLVNEIKGKTHYESCWLVRADAPYQTVDELRGKPICFASRTSTSGYILPMADLVRTGRLRQGGAAEEYFGAGNVYYGTGYVSAIERLLNGQVEAAAVSDYVIDEDKHLTADQKQRLRVLARQGPVPTHILAVRPDMPEAEQAQLKKALLHLNEEPWVELRDRAFTAKLIDVDVETHVSSLQDSLDKIGFKP
jgi:phosphonate transport system substrate-binding protein